jgi:hypothetical protein
MTTAEGFNYLCQSMPFGLIATTLLNMTLLGAHGRTPLVASV